MTYLARDPQSGLVKIGRSANVPRRMRQLGTKLLVAIPGDHENRLHTRFTTDWVRGEWFKPSPLMVALVRRLQGRTKPTGPRIDLRDFVDLPRDWSNQRLVGDGR